MADKVYPAPTAPPLIPSSSSTRKEHSPHHLPPHVNVDVAYNQPLPAQQPQSRPVYRKRGSRSCCCCCLMWVVSLVVAIALILGIAALVLYLVLQPKIPSYNIKDTTNTEFNLLSSSSSSSAFTLTSRMDIAVEANNPNKKIGIYYDVIETTLLYDESVVGLGSTAAFYQGHQNTTLFAISVKGQDTPLTTAVGSALKTTLDNGNDSSLGLEADTVVKARLKIGGWKSQAFKIKVECTLLIDSPSSSSASVASQDCKAKLAQPLGLALLILLIIF